MRCTSHYTSDPGVTNQLYLTAPNEYISASINCASQESYFCDVRLRRQGYMDPSRSSICPLVVFTVVQHANATGVVQQWHISNG
jgi:hypothetical protein